MMEQKTVRFDAALRAARDILQPLPERLGYDVIIVRDLLGRIRVILDHPQPLPPDLQPGLNRQLSERCGRFWTGENGIMPRTQLFDAEAILAEPKRHAVGPGPQLLVMERQITGYPWVQTVAPSADRTNRIAFFGAKGGVGRSTALAVWARHLATSGKNVLVVDLDLESPGVGYTLLSPETLPEFGIVDWFVEDAVGQADNALLLDSIAWSPWSQGCSGDIRVVPAAGQNRDSFFHKLSRCYFDEDSDLGLAKRLPRLIEALEAQVKPDFVFLDSRTGIHDLAALTITGLGARTLLFAGMTEQVWAGYQLLFENWSRNPGIRTIRENLRMVAALVPETAADEYLSRFIHRSHELFTDTMYDEAGPEDLDAFNFDTDDPDAPHYPLRINWSRALQEFDPVRHPMAVSDSMLRGAFGDFLRDADRWLGE